VPAFLTGEQAIAMIDGKPSAASVNAVEAAHPTMAAALKGATVVGLGELGGAYDGSGGGTQTETSSVAESVDLSQFASEKDLLVGFYQGTQVGAGVSDLTLDITANGTDVFHQEFTNSAAAVAFFTDHTLDLGIMTAFGSALDIAASMTTTEASPGAGLDFGLLIANGSHIA
jgi:hypothetical protein